MAGCGMNTVNTDPSPAVLAGGKERDQRVKCRSLSLQQFKQT